MLDLAPYHLRGVILMGFYEPMRKMQITQLTWDEVDLKNNLIEPSFVILCIFLGHLFPIWIRFKGGKGIAVIIGCLLGYNFFYGLIFSLVWLVTAVVSKYSSLSALVASLSILIIVYLENDNIFLMVLLMVTMIFLKHISNIRRLLKGNELRINLKK